VTGPPQFPPPTAAALGWCPDVPGVRLTHILPPSNPWPRAATGRPIVIMAGTAGQSSVCGPYPMAAYHVAADLGERVAAEPQAYVLLSSYSPSEGCAWQVRVAGASEAGARRAFTRIAAALREGPPR
jgi:hypothetical protein